MGIQLLLAPRMTKLMLCIMVLYLCTAEIHGGSRRYDEDDSVPGYARYCLAPTQEEIENCIKRSKPEYVPICTPTQKEIEECIDRAIEIDVENCQLCIECVERTEDKGGCYATYGCHSCSTFKSS